MRDCNYFALDLELNARKEPFAPKIIQVGVAVGNPNFPGEIETASWFLNPFEPIDPFITKLTGISDETIELNAVTHDTLAKELGDFLSTHQAFVNPVTWGQGDAQELLSEFKQRGIHFPFFGRRIIDVKTIFVFLEMVNGRSPSGGLSKSMAKYKIPFQGVPHRADQDALNTLRFFFHLIGRQETLESAIRDFKGIAF